MQGSCRGVRQRILAVWGSLLLQESRWFKFLRFHIFLKIFLLGAAIFICYTTLNIRTPDLTPSLQNKTSDFRKLLGEEKFWSGNTTVSTAEEPSGTFPLPDTWTSTTAKPASHQQVQTTAKPVSHHVVPTTADNEPPEKSFSRFLVEYPSEYHFVINEEKSCEEAKPFVVLIIPVAAANREHRDIIRSTWGGVNLVLGKVVRHFFLVGLHGGDDSQQIQQQLLNESQQHHDLIQSDFVDCYKNLTIKTMVMMEWLDQYCANASYAMKVDSDTFLNVKNLVKILLKAPRRNYMTGLVCDKAPVLRKTYSKWFLPKKLYPRKALPKYAIGMGYIVSLDLPKKLIWASRHVQAIYIEDVYLGLCMEYLKISPTPPPDYYQFQLRIPKHTRCVYSKIIVTLNLPNIDPVERWNNFTAPGPYCQLPQSAAVGKQNKTK